MEAATWSAIALVAALSMGTLFYLGSRFDGLAADTDRRFEALTASLDARFARVDARFDRVDDRLIHLEDRLDAHLGRHAG